MWYLSLSLPRLSPKIFLVILLENAKNHKALNVLPEGISFDDDILTLSLPEWKMEFCKVFLNFDSVDEILWSENLSTCNFTWCYLSFKILQNEIYEFLVNFAFGHIWQWKGFIRIFYSEIKSYNHSRCRFHWLWVWNGQGLSQMSINGVRLDPLCPKQNSVVIGANKGPYNTLLRLTGRQSWSCHEGI